jgi:hypothetical protein
MGRHRHEPCELVSARQACVGSWCVPKPDGLDHATLNAALPADVEIVTGWEGEQLILTVHRHFTEQAGERGLTFEEFVRTMEPTTGAGRK